MARLLAGISLDAGVVWTDLYNWQAVSVASTRTTSGRMIIARQQLRGGRPVTLAWKMPYAWLTYAELQAIRAAITADYMVFQWDDVSGIVTLAGPDGLEIEPMTNTYHPEMNRFFATLKLIMVS